MLVWQKLVSGLYPFHCFVAMGMTIAGPSFSSIPFFLFRIDVNLSNSLRAGFWPTFKMEGEGTKPRYSQVILFGFGTRGKNKHLRLLVLFLGEIFSRSPTSECPEDGEI